MRILFFRLTPVMALAGIVLLVIAVTGCRSRAMPLSAPQWQQAAAGMEVCRYSDPDEQERARMIVVRVDPARCKIQVVDAHQGVDGQGANAEDVCPRNGAAINASFFAEDLSPLGLLVIDGKQVQARFPRHEWGVFRVRGGKAEIVRSTKERVRGITQALESKPRLVVEGKVQSFKPQGPARRSAIGIDQQGRVILAATSEYLTLEEWATLLHNKFGCVNALNLDGGPSTQLAVRGEVAAGIPGGWPVPVLLTVTPR